MRIAGFLLLLSGWVIVIAAIALLPHSLVQTGFAVAGVAVEILGVVLLIRSGLAPNAVRS